MEDENLTEEALKRKAKKKLAMIVAGSITFIIFCGWLFYFIGRTKEDIAKDSKFALFDDLKENTKKSFEEIKSVFGDLTNKIYSVRDYYDKNAVATTSSTSTEINQK